MYEFTDDCLIHIEEIDNEHRHLFSLINESIALVAEASDVTTISKTLSQGLKTTLLIILRMKRHIWRAYMTRS